MNISASIEGDFLTLEIHYGGTLHKYAKGGYVGGCTTTLFFKLPTELDYDKIVESVYMEVPNVAQLWYRERSHGSFGSSLRVLGCQQDLLQMVDCLEKRMIKTNYIDIYVEHIDGYESDTASVEHLSDWEGDELYTIRMQRLEARESREQTQEDVETCVRDDEGTEVEVDVSNWEVGTGSIQHGTNSNEDEEENEGEAPIFNDGEDTWARDWNGEDIWGRHCDGEQLNEAEDVSDGVRSEYPSSDEYDSPTMDSDDEGLQRIAPFFPIFNPFMNPFKDCTD